MAKSMTITRRTAAVLFTWATLFTASVPICAAQDYRLAFTENPFTYEVWVDDERVVDQNVADTAHTSLYFVTEEGAQYLEQSHRFEASDIRLDAEFATSDGRRARLTIRPAEHGGYRLDLRFDPQAGILAVGEMLWAHPGEQFQGLSERVIGNEDPSDPPEPGRRGHFVEVESSGPNSRFYLSSRGYGLYLDCPRTGYFDMASRIADRIQLKFEGTSLTYEVFLGEEIVSDYSSVVGR